MWHLTKVDFLKSLRTATVADGRILHLYSEETAGEVEKTIHAEAKKSGAAFRIGNGPVQWYEDCAVMDTTKTGSAVYTWDKTGNRIKHDRVLVSRDQEGNLTRKKIGTVYKTYGED